MPTTLFNGIFINEKSITIQKAKVDNAGEIVLDANDLPLTESITFSREKAIINTSGVNFSTNGARDSSITISVMGINTYFEINHSLLDGNQIVVSILGKLASNMDDIWLFIRDSF